MRRSLTLAMLALASVLGAAVYQVSYSTMALERELGRLTNKIQATEKAKRVLAAEWSLLNSPVRIEALARRHLGFAPLSGEQFVALSDLPMARPAAAPTLVAEGVRPKSKPAELRAQSIAASNVSAQSQLAAANGGRVATSSLDLPSDDEKFAAMISGLTR
ncbi:MAG: hypothetical protein EXQ88_01415 [Alphaproteobacteria bacterium]|nr:hypothetical protein [Alphaproteobacteria bacterium]